MFPTGSGHRSSSENEYGRIPFIPDIKYRSFSSQLALESIPGQIYPYLVYLSFGCLSPSGFLLDETVVNSFVTYFSF